AAVGEIVAGGALRGRLLAGGRIGLGQELADRHHRRRRATLRLLLLDVDLVDVLRQLRRVHDEPGAVPDQQHAEQRAEHRRGDLVDLEAVHCAPPPLRALYRITLAPGFAWGGAIRITRAAGWQGPPRRGDKEWRDRAIRSS